MSRVHDALRKAAHERSEAAKSASDRSPLSPPIGQSAFERPSNAQFAADQLMESYTAHGEVGETDLGPAVEERSSVIPNSSWNGTEDLENLENIIRQVPAVKFAPAADALLVSPTKPKDAPSEEFRSLRTRLNHLQTSQPLHTLVITSASPGEGKSFTACNLAMSQAQLAGKRILLADFDFRRPSVGHMFGIKGVPGITDYLLGKVRIGDIMHRLGDTNLYIMTAGESVPNPLELLNLKQCGSMIEALRDHFDWVILDSPPLLFAADGNLLATMADGTILVVRIGSTTHDSVTRALQSLCENNVVGTVVNGAHRGELYSRYSYYHNYYYEPDNRQSTPVSESMELEPVGTGKS